MWAVPVELVHQPFNYAPWVQIGVSALTIVGSIGSAYVLQDRGLRQQALRELTVQVASLVAIASRAEAILTRLNKRAVEESFRREELGWLKNECESLAGMIGNIDLMSIRDASLITHIAELQEAARTGNRRFEYAMGKVRRGLPTKADDFKDPLERAQRALRGLSEYRLPKKPTRR